MKKLIKEYNEMIERNEVSEEFENLELQLIAEFKKSDLGLGDIGLSEKALKSLKNELIDVLLGDVLHEELIHDDKIYNDIRKHMVEKLFFLGGFEDTKLAVKVQLEFYIFG